MARQIILATLLCMSFSALALASYITWYGLSDDIKKADLIIVFGNAVNSDGSLSPRLQARMDKAIQLFKEARGTYLFVSGALGKEGVEESGAMKKYAIAQGVPEAQIIADPLGINSDATAKNAAVFMHERELKSALLVSQFFHMARATFAFKNYEIWDLGHAHADFFEIRDFYSLAREVIALPAYSLRFSQG
jgi:vancomycin permeability regulator SanA